MTYYLILIGMFFSLIAHALPEKNDLTLDVDYQISPRSLTTDDVFQLDPFQLNPHHQRWILHRKTHLYGLKTFQKKDGRYGVFVQGLQSVLKGYLRPQGAAFQKLASFSCSSKPDPLFQTEEGAKIALSVAKEVWENILKNERVQLNILLNRVDAKTAEGAVQKTQKIFQDWYQKVDYRWRSEAFTKARSKEWANYVEEAKEAQFCLNGIQKKAVTTQTPNWRSIMEKVPNTPPLPVTSVLARAPARLWNGLFSIRLTIGVWGKNLNGRFLIDSQAARSILSPEWLEGQGINPGWILVPGARPEQVTWSGSWKGELGLARKVFVDAVQIGTLHLPMEEFLLYPTEFFDPPETVGSCCDGILGRDFLRLFPVEFQSSIPAEVRIWPREDFHASPDTPWVEVHENEKSQLVSSCSASSSSSSARYLGASWDLGSEEGLSIQGSLPKSSRKGSEASWDLECDGVKLAEGVSASFQKNPGGKNAKFSDSTRRPEVSVGIELLSQGTSIFDLPHGRIWFKPNKLPLKNPKQNKTGLTLSFVQVKNDRVLKVVQLRKTPLSEGLIHQGLKVGAQITSIDETPAEDLDLWEINKRLAGEFGNVIKLDWKVNHSIQTGLIRMTGVHKEPTPKP